MTKGKIYQLSRYGNLLIVNAALRDLRLNKVPVKVGWAKTTNKLSRKYK